MILTQLLIALSVATAHAAPSEISLHNERTLLESIVVSNWTQLCQHLCSLNLSGPGCGLDNCNSIPVELNEEDFSIISSQHHDELCETLCENGLGVNKCDCKIPITMFSSKSSMKPDKRKICSDFCRFHRVTLRGCSPCPPHFLRESEKEAKKEDESGERKSPLRPSRPVVALLPPPLSLPVFPVRQSMVGHLFEFQATTDTTTTPDWNRVCAQLCRSGSGGLLCNCDLPPF